MTDHSTARALVEKLRNIHARLPDVRFGDAWAIEDAADFIEQSLTPPDALSDSRNRSKNKT